MKNEFGKNRKVISLALLLGMCVAAPVLADDHKDHGVNENRDIEVAVSDARIEGQLWSTYALSEHLSAFDIDVSVYSGEVTLTGAVEDDVQKDLAEEIARGIDGVDDVDNNIEVASDTERRIRGDDDSDRSFGDRVSDATTTATVKSKLLWNRNTGGLDINVSTRNGNLTLEGESDSEASKELAERLASNTDGVRSVDNRIQVVADVDSDDDDGRDMGDAVSDSWITTKVKSTLLFSSDVSGLDISVDTKDGVVTLEGEADHARDRQRAVQLSRDIKGVKQVNADAVRIEDRRVDDR